MKAVDPFEFIKELGLVSGDGVCVYDLLGNKFLYANKVLAGILETSMEDIIDRPERLKSILQDDEGYLLNRFRELNMNSRVMNAEIKLKAKSDKYISVDACILNGNWVFAIVKDITQAKQHFNYIVEFGARKDTLLDMVAHNLIGPLNLTTSLLDSIDKLTRSIQYKKIDNHTRLVRESVQQCLEIINSFLIEEHLESERISVQQKRYDVIEKVNIIIERLKEFDINKKIHLTSKSKELWVNGDDVKFFQIIHNLLSNAVKFTPDKGKILVDIKERDALFELTVMDNGIGIPEHLQPHLFKRNTPASREGLKGEKSIGMGLYICKKLTELMKGRIFIVSEENRGTEIKIILPKE